MQQWAIPEKKQGQGGGGRVERTDIECNFQRYQRKEFPGVN